MTMIVVLFNLKKNVKREDYEAWALSTDIPTVNQLSPVNQFSVYRTSGLLGSEDKPPYEYVELLDVADLDALGEQLGSEQMQAIAAEFQTLADNPIFMLTEHI